MSKALSKVDSYSIYDSNRKCYGLSQIKQHWGIVYR